MPLKFPVLPEKAEFEKLAQDFDWRQGGIPLGYSLTIGEIKGILPERAVCFLVSGRERTGRTTLLSVLLRGLLYCGREVVVVDEKGALARFREEPGVIYLQGGAEAEDWRRACEKSGPEKAGAPGIGVLIGNLGYFCRFLYQNSPDREEKIRFWEQAAVGKGPVGFLAGIYHPERDYEAAGTGFFREMITWQQGIHLGGNAADQRALSFDDLSYALQSRREAPGTGYLKEGAGSSTCRIRVPS